MKTQIASLILALTCSTLSAAEPAQVLLEDSFDQAGKAERRPTRGDWKIAKGVAACTQDDALYEKHKQHGPALWFDLEFKDALIEFDLKCEGCTNFVFTVNGKDGHVFRFVTGSTRTGVRAWPPELADHKSIESGNGKTSIGGIAEWTSVRVELKGSRSLVGIGDAEPIVAEHPSYAVNKNVIGLGFSFGKASFRNVRVRALK